MSAHGITAVLPTHPTSGPASKNYMDQFDGHFDNLAAAATNSGAALDQLAVTTPTQYTEIKALLAALKTASNFTSIPSSYATAAATDSAPLILPTDTKWRISQLEAAVCNNWHRGAFCSTHSWGVKKITRARTAVPRSPAMFPLPHVLTLQAREEQSINSGTISYQKVVFQPAPDIPGHLVII